LSPSEVLIRGLRKPSFDASIQIQNVVAAATLNQRFNLKAIVKGNPTVEYRPRTFPGLVFRLKRPRTAILIFNSGKMVCTGATKEDDIHEAIHNLSQQLEKNDLIYH
jgi:transcription initiation factor TFIID TATA-box-binding protein